MMKNSRYRCLLACQIPRGNCTGVTLEEQGRTHPSKVRILCILRYQGVFSGLRPGKGKSPGVEDPDGETEIPDVVFGVAEVGFRP